MEDNQFKLELYKIFHIYYYKLIWENNNQNLGKIYFRRNPFIKDIHFSFKWLHQPP